MFTAEAVVWGFGILRKLLQFQLEMVICAVVGCHKTSGRDTDVSFCSIPKVLRNECRRTEELSRSVRLS